MAPIAPGGELLVITASAVDPVTLGPELFIHKGFPTGGAQETGLVPMLVFVGQVLQQTVEVYHKVVL